MTLVMFPDYKGEAIMASSDPNGFVARLRRAMPDGEIMPIINGLSEVVVEHCADMAAKLGFRPLISTGVVGKGLYAALYDGYQEAIKIARGPIIRLDTAEHPPEYIPQLLEALKTADMVIGDLTFTEKTLRPGSPDERAHLVTFPEMYGEVTGGKLRISCAHGFQGFQSRSALELIFWRAAWRMHQVMEREGPISWGMDGAMALAACKGHWDVRISPVPAEKLRDRPEAKIKEQERTARLLIDVFNRH